MPLNVNQVNIDRMTRTSDSTFDYTIDGDTTFTVPLALEDNTVYEYTIKREASVMVDSSVTLDANITYLGDLYWNDFGFAHEDATGYVDMYEKLYVMRSGSTLYHAFEVTPVVNKQFDADSPAVSFTYPIPPGGSISQGATIAHYDIDNTTKAAPTLNGSNQVILTMGFKDIPTSQHVDYDNDLGGGYREFGYYDLVYTFGQEYNRVKVRISKIS